jgi:hypothetical protein
MDTWSFGSPYDFESIMHYSGGEGKSRKFWQKFGNKRVERVFGRKDSKMSPEDMKQLNRMYKCPGYETY